MGPGCTVADVRPDGVTVWSGTQKTHALREGISKLLKTPLAQVRVIWVSDAGSYGRGRLEESAAAAALLSHAVGPARSPCNRCVPTTRSGGNKAPAMTGTLRANVRNGTIVALDVTLRQFDGNEIFSQPNGPGGFIAGQMAGFPNEGGTVEFGQYGGTSAKYEIANLRSTAEIIAPFTPANSPPAQRAHARSRRSGDPPSSSSRSSMNSPRRPPRTPSPFASNI